jgi:alcohol dehydrogenase YqhD (iron-dependent ADH family)
MGLPTRLARYQNVKAETPQLVADALVARGFLKLGERGAVTPDVVKQILARSLAA